MKRGIHPTTYQQVVFKDVNNDFALLTWSTRAATCTETIQWKDGQIYPLVSVQVSSASHPFYTGRKTTVDELGTIAKFHAKYGKRTG